LPLHYREKHNFSLNVAVALPILGAELL